MDLADPSPRFTLRRSRVAHFDRDAHSAVVSLRGEHDITTVDELSAVLHCAVVLSDDRLVVDLGKVEFLDASTIGAVIACRLELELLGRSLALRSPTVIGRRLLDICGLQSLLDPPEGGRPTQRALVGHDAPV